LQIKPEGDIKVSLRLSNILLPNLNGESKRTGITNFDERGGGDLVLDGLGGNDEGVEVKSVED